MFEDTKYLIRSHKEGQIIHLPTNRGDTNNLQNTTQKSKILCTLLRYYHIKES